jgi:hypothetical protein
VNAKLEAITTKAASDLTALVADGESKILEAWNSAEAEAQDNDTAPKFRLTLSISLDLDKDTMETALSFGVRHKLSVNRQIPDPNQETLL